MVNQKSSPRSIRLRALFTDVLKGTKTIDNKNAKLFLEAIRDQDSNKALCVQKIQASDHGRAAFQAALSSSTELCFLHESVTPILRYLAAPELKTLCGGVVLQQLITSFIEAELVWVAYITAFKAGQLAGDGECNGEEAFSWLLLELLSLPKEKAYTFVHLAQDSSIKGALLESHKQGVRLRAHRITHIVENLIAGHDNYHSNEQSSSSGPGGRHNNDFAEINKIAILPTTDELAAKDPYLPHAHETKTLAKRPDGLAFYLDGQFRLLREDMLRDLREEIHVALNMQKEGSGGRAQKAFSVEHLSMVGVNCDGRNPWSLLLQCMNDLPQMPKKSEAIRRQFLKDNPKYLKHESLACVIADDEVVTLGTLVREEDLLAANPPVLCLQIPGPNEETALRYIKAAKVVKLVQLNTTFFSYAPILERLKEMKELPFEDEILRWEENYSPKPPAYLLSPIITALVEDLRRNPSRDLQGALGLPRPTKLDKSQAECFITGMTTRLSTIQGPPAGTGKSFIGALIAKAIFLYSDETILVLTYKHHALDQFLIDLIDLGISKTEIVRLGSAKKAAASVRDLSIKDAASLVRLTREQCQMLDWVKAKVRDEGDTLQQAFTGLEQQAPSKDDILEHLEFLTEGPPFFAAFQVPQRNDGIVHVGKNGKMKFNASYLLDRWRRGKDATPFKKMAQQYPEVWNIKASARHSLLRQWEADILKERFDAVHSAGHNYNKELEQVASIYLERELTVLRSKRVIACTTTAAAKYVQMLNSARPGVVLVEEAGEILESHVLTALGPDTKQLILIGDHKQLRPKVNFALSVEKGDGYELNQSLFERLVVQQGYPYTTLLQQHRMRPELAGFVRELTYPDLVDASSTKNRPKIKGLQDNIIFLNHSHSEEQMKHVRDWKDGTSPATKRNLYETHMAIKCLRYLGQQDINTPTDKIVILTPYLGQLHLLREELSKANNDPVLNDLDSHDLARAGLMPPATAQVNKPKIKISTIDNFQGDESEIVIVTLTRSNDNGDIGFMSSPERLNVLLSRARNGLIIIGNAETFMSSKKGGKLWKRFIDMLKAKNHIYHGLPVKCEQHPARHAVLRSPEDFENECPDGGCKEPCGALLKCGVHKCPRNCHYRSDHSQMKCDKIVETKCAKGHVQTRKCSEISPLKCRKCEIETQRDQKTLERDMALQDKRLQEQVKYEMSLAELDMQIRKIREEAEDKKTAQERAQALEQKKRDLEAAQHNATQPPPTTNTAANDKKYLAPQQSETNNRKASAVSTPSARNESASAVEWERQKRVEGEHNAALDDLMALSGLEEVKEKFLDIKTKIETAARQGIDVKKERMGMVMLGNPGTAGKTTVARIYARFLASVGALPGKEFTEITGSGLANDGVAGAKKIIEGLIKAGGGVFFIDEAYQLASGNNFGGKNVLDFILAEIEERRGTIAFILAGYDKEMEKFFEHNPGFDSRMPHRLKFADYSDDVLLTMLKALVEKKYNGRATLEDDGSDLYARILTKRLGRRRGTEGYGNARDLENVWAQVTERQASRLKKERIAGGLPDDLIFTKEDIIGHEPSGVIKDSAAWKKLQSLVGLEKVKKSVKALVDAMQRNYHRELKDLDPLEFTLHRVFLGSPGTGKTTVAKLYGAILADMGLLSKREVVVKNPSDFVGSALGQSEENTKKILKAAAGKVLVIDEAYGLDAGGGVGSGHKDPFKTAVIDTIVAQVQNTPGEDLCVLLLGYQEQMEEMMNRSNPGLARRFRLSDAFYFEDFSDADLMHVLDFKLKEQGLKATADAKRTAIEVLARERDRPNFGNAGAVENIISRAKELEQKRTSAVETDGINPDVFFLPQDFDEDYDRASAAGLSCRDLFADIVGCEKLIKKLERYQQIAQNMKTTGKDPRTLVPFNFLFKGPPGTGKTTVARKMGQLYYEMGILGSSEYVECSASDLIGQYVGQTGPKTQGKLTEALGRVLFVDEAYRFCDGHFGKEAVNELVDCLTKQKYMGKIVVILAGYTHQIDELLQINPGLSSRFPEEVVFENMDPEICVELLDIELKKNDIEVTPPLNNELLLVERQQMIDIFAKLSRLRSWGNGRDVKNIAKDICSDAFAGNMSKELRVTFADILRHLNKMLKSQMARNESREDFTHPTNHGFSSSLLPPMQDLPKAPITASSITSKTETAEPVPTNEKEVYEKDTSEDIADSTQRDPGVSDEVWQQLQRNIAEEKALKQVEDMFISAQQRDYEAHKESETVRLKEIQRLEEEKRLADESRRKVIEEQLRQEKRCMEAALKAKREAEEKLRKAQEEAEKRRQQELAVQKKIRDMGICPAGFRWIKGGAGYRCAGGSHYLSNSQLGI
ncbi:P-loop containing nucleoside triphosphate hydrolase protein [Talaromyces proteolyticus]|uniref:P-loop containing nucleoside triphosphate hydrolase protein n=1 Tax=Talaromyces proteolyticus TaxID=1131652 RepID=A0AAD4PWI3_9EURO|nr:P-loop containing nucleoside triphosphate hydrolase protein [Talaromyces proteolyticus]KAH8691554.1 P-loop containing nucleoside triphosphate hydrolase protein [Talaromyces proteolyticus]